jgi:hypothetical protein
VTNFTENHSVRRQEDLSEALAAKDGDKSDFCVTAYLSGPSAGRYKLNKLAFIYHYLIKLSRSKMKIAANRACYPKLIAPPVLTGRAHG